MIEDALNNAPLKALFNLFCVVSNSFPICNPPIII
jgi:hypothetical protein